MLVVPSGELQHHAHAHNDSRDADYELQPTSPTAHQPLNMEVATATADAQLAPDVSPAPDNNVNAPALNANAPTPNDVPSSTNGNSNGDTAINGRSNGLAEPISFSQPADMTAAAAANATALDMNMNNMNLNMNMDVDMGMGMAAPDFPVMPFPPPTASDERLTAFARLRFDDGSYYMHTYQIILGRNIDLARRDLRRIAKHDKLRAEGNPQAAEEILNPSASKKRKRQHKARSVISEKGGIVSAPIDRMPAEYQRRQSNASHSLSSASHPTGESGEERPVERAPQDMLMQAFPEVPSQFDGHVPEDPQDCPLVPIHPQFIVARTGSHGPKGISRHHAKIFYSFELQRFCVEVLGSNGLHHEHQFKEQGDIVPLDHGDRLDIGAVKVDFFLPDVALHDSERDRQDSNSRPMSFAFENGRGELESDEQFDSESEAERSINPRHVFHHPMDSDSESDDMDADADDMDDYQEPVPKSRQKTAPKLKLKMSVPAPPTKESKKAHKRKHRDVSPDDIPLKKLKKQKEHKEATKEPPREPKAAKEPKATKEAKEKETKELHEPKEVRDKGKAPAKTSSKTPVKQEEPTESMPRETPVIEKPEPTKPVPNDSPPLLRKPLEGELEAGGEIEGLITEEMARHHNLPATLIGQVVEKRKGPGRPPKDGIMSKRQRSQLIKQAKEIERAKAAGIDPADIPMPSVKPKITKRKDSNAADGEDGDVRESTEPGDGLGGDRKSLKPSKPPRTPSPEPRIEDYTEEQLQRPTANYVVLIHEAISSSSTGQMNLQQIYNYIERKYPWYKFKTTTSGWQSSVRHNLGQHDAFVKGDKEGKGFNWKINQEVSIEKERRKRQLSPTANNTPRPPYYPGPPNGYPQYPQPGYPYHPGMAPHSMPQAAPRLPPSLANAQPRLPPSMARESSTTAAATTQNAPRPSPYASPWAGGNTAGSPPAPSAPTPYPPTSSATPPVTSGAGGSGPYGVLYPSSSATSYSHPPATASPYGGPYAAAGASPYASAPSRPYAPYPPQGQQAAGAPGYQAPSQAPAQSARATENSPSGRYLSTTHPDLIRQLEAFRKVYLEARKEPGEDQKVDNAIRAYVDPQFNRDGLTDPERSLLSAISGIQQLSKYNEPAAQPAPVPADVPPAATSTTSAGTAAAIAADAAANTAPPSATPLQPGPSTNPTNPESLHQTTSEPQRFAPNVTGSSTAVPTSSAPVPSVPSLPASHRPSVEPLTPVPGSPAVQSGTPLRRSLVELPATATDTNEGTEAVSQPSHADQGSQPDGDKAVADESTKLAE
ncbi:hypothetical protein IQ06DRAFT_247562 [Phaeosphaeriaceae sp. SRC1lsM3a]|nr:hypothetical protein IQ06DRAFT_247562 [Stagonospora sp. SRC1lsM3a]